jgi:hypothetical protein
MHILHIMQIFEKYNVLSYHFVLNIIGFMNFVHLSEFYVNREYNFLKIGPVSFVR